MSSVESEREQDELSPQELRAYRVYLLQILQARFPDWDAEEWDLSPTIQQGALITILRAQSSRRYSPL